MTVDEYYEWMFDNSIPGLPETASEHDLTPIEYMRKFGAFEVDRDIGQVYETEVEEEELDDVAEDEFGRVYTRTPKPSLPNLAPTGAPDSDDEGRRPVGVRMDEKILKGFPTPSENLSSTRQRSFVGVGPNMHSQPISEAMFTRR